MYTPSMLPSSAILLQDVLQRNNFEDLSPARVVNRPMHRVGRKVMKV